MTLGFALDALIVLLLLVVLAVGIRLHLTLRGLRWDTDSFERFTRDLTGATERAESALHDLKATAGQTRDGLGADLDGAQRMADELRMLIARGERLAERLAGAISEGRPLEQGRAEPKRGPGAANGVDTGRPPRDAAPSPSELERTLRTLR